MGGAYPEIVKQHELVLGVVSREEERFRQTLARGLELLDGVLGRGDVTGEDAFFLHDTLGFPIDLTREIAEERGRTVDLDGFHARMAEQRTRAKEAHKAAGGKGDGAPLELYRELLDELGPDRLHRPPGVRDRRRQGARARRGPRAPRAGRRRHRGRASCSTARRSTPSPAARSATPGPSRRPSGARVRIDDTQYGLPGLVLHRGVVEEGTIAEGDEAVAADRRRRAATPSAATTPRRTSCTGRCARCSARTCKQAGSFVGPDRLRFDFSHHEAVTRDQLDRIEALANAEIISDAPVRHYETTKEHAGALGAIAFFGDKYGDLVRVLEAGEHSIELCGGTHVHALGFIGPIKIVSEGSIGANLRRIEAVTGEGALARIHDEEVQLARRWPARCR